MKREKELALTLAVKLVEQDKSITSSTKKANASVEVAKILEQYLKESTDECFKNPYEQVFMGGDIPTGDTSCASTTGSTSITTKKDVPHTYTGGGKLP